MECSLQWTPRVIRLCRMIENCLNPKILLKIIFENALDPSARFDSSIGAVSGQCPSEPLSHEPAKKWPGIACHPLSSNALNVVELDCLANLSPAI